MSESRGMLWSEDGERWRIVSSKDGGARDGDSVAQTAKGDNSQGNKIDPRLAAHRNYLLPPSELYPYPPSPTLPYSPKHSLSLFAVPPPQAALYKRPVFPCIPTGTC